MSFSYTVKTKRTIAEAVENLQKELKSIGFGVIGNLDFQKILTSKGLEFEKPYQLLEVCNPSLAKQVLDTNPDLGLLLPCTIAVYEKNGDNHISLSRPTSMLEMASEDNLRFMGEEIEKISFPLLTK